MFQKTMTDAHIYIILYSACFHIDISEKLITMINYVIVVIHRGYCVYVILSSQTWPAMISV